MLELQAETIFSSDTTTWNYFNHFFKLFQHFQYSLEMHNQQLFTVEVFNLMYLLNFKTMQKIHLFELYNWRVDWLCLHYSLSYYLSIIIFNLHVSVDSSSGSYLPVETDSTCGTRADIGESGFGDFPFLAAIGYDVGGKIHYESDGIIINRLFIFF